MPIQYIGSKQVNAGRGPSPALWGDCPVTSYGSHIQGKQGIVEFNEFLGFKNFGEVSSETYQDQGLNAFSSASTTGTVVTVEATGLLGALRLTPAANNTVVHVRSASIPVRIARGKGDVWFEARVVTSTIGDTTHSFVVGLMDSTGLSATVPLGTAGALGTVSGVFFHRQHGSGGGSKLSLRYKSGSMSAVTVVDTLATLAADTPVKVGLKFLDDAEGLVRFYVNGLEQASLRVPASAPGAGDNAAGFPNDVNLGLVFGVRSATDSGAGNSSLDWYKIIRRVY